jgi:hypothetical protein
MALPRHAAREAVVYAAVIKYKPASGQWRWSERIRIPRKLFTRKALAAPRDLGAAWHYVDVRGRNGALLLYGRVSTFKITTHVWPALTKAHLKLPVLRSRLLLATVVPRDGSVVELRAPSRMIHDTDPSGQRSGYGGTDIVSVRIAGLEDELAEPELRFEVANGFGRTMIYGTLSGITEAGIVAWLFGIVAATVVTFVCNRLLERRFPKPS